VIPKGSRGRGSKDSSEKQENIEAPCSKLQGVFECKEIYHSWIRSLLQFKERNLDIERMLTALIKSLENKPLNP